MSKYGVISGPYIPVFGPEITPYLNTFQAVCVCVCVSFNVIDLVNHVSVFKFDQILLHCSYALC